MEDEYVIRKVVNGLYITVKESRGGYEVDIFDNNGGDLSKEDLLKVIPILNE